MLEAEAIVAHLHSKWFICFEKLRNSKHTKVYNKMIRAIDPNHLFASILLLLVYP